MRVILRSSMWYLPENSNLTTAHNDHNVQRSILARSLNSPSTPMGRAGSMSNGLPASSPGLSRNTPPARVQDSNGFNERMSPQAFQTTIRGLVNSRNCQQSSTSAQDALRAAAAAASNRASNASSPDNVQSVGI